MILQGFRPFLLLSCYKFNFEAFKSSILYEFNSGLQFIKGFVIVNPVPGILGNVAHKEINTFPVGPGAVQDRFKGVAATVRGSGDLKPFS